ncbi:hypothetical protein ATANTOWER_017469 [Ataeniobius toweri]|uniref:Uncharacterized protein n=1 Tax=Ataeniobius toweri TaxID=208326 RepID=A0ABU7BIS3_9TELE|nr:hypothetical protein [Ataeniobius toweri]
MTLTNSQTYNTGDYLDVTQAGPTDCFPKLPCFQTAEEPELLRRLAAADLLDSLLLAAARRLLPHAVTAEPVHPPLLSSNPAPALFVQEQLPTLGSAPSPSPPGGVHTQPTAAAYQSHPVFLSTIKLITNFPASPECSLHTHLWDRFTNSSNPIVHFPFLRTDSSRTPNNTYH